MSKHKIIHKFFDPRRQLQDRQALSDSSDEEPFQLQEVDCNHFFQNQNQDYSLLDLFDTLQSNDNQSINQQEEYQHSDIQNQSDLPTCSILEQINARYQALMNDVGQQQSLQTREDCLRVRFEGKVRAKYFRKQEAVVEVFDAEQYTSFDQYQQSQEVVEQRWEN